MAKVNSSGKKTAKKVIPSSVTAKSDSELHEVDPRETVGGATGQKFEFQYERNAIGCLELLESAENYCIFCEWHDDYVLEKNNSTSGANAKVLYTFHQVKTKEAHLGPWKLNEIFEINTNSIAKPEKVSDSFFYKMMRHFSDFGSTVDKIVFQTNASIEKDLRIFLEDLDSASKKADLEKCNLDHFDNIYKQYDPLFTDLTENIFFNILKKFKIIYDEAILSKSSEDYKSKLAEKIIEYSEIDLKVSQAGTIGKELLEKVRKKSHAILKFKANKDTVREIKGIEIDELLELLSLSYSGYKSLLAGGDKNAIKKLSRLQRLIEESDSELNDEIIKAFCECKSNWDTYNRKIRHDNNLEPEYLQLKAKAMELLKDWTKKPDFDFEKLVDHSEVLATQYKAKFSSIGELNKTLVVGLVLSCSIDGD